MDTREKHYEAVIIGGGAAGLGGALALGRSRRSVLVIDGGEPRNAPADGVHMYLGRENVPPAELLAIGRDEAAGYGVEIVRGSVAKVQRTESAFQVTCDDGSSVLADRLLVATGLVDEIPAIPGLAERWGHDVLHCPYCHGWEVRDQAIGVLATGPLSVHQAQLWRQISADVMFFQNDVELTDEDAEKLAARGITVVTGPVVAVEIKDGKLVGLRLADGHVIAREAIAVGPKFNARADFLAGLGLEPVEQEMNGVVIARSIPADPMTGATSVPGVWVAGNVTNVMDQVISAAAAGARAGAMINADLVDEETRRAVAERSAV